MLIFVFNLCKLVFVRFDDVHGIDSFDNIDMKVLNKNKIQFILTQDKKRKLIHFILLLFNSSDRSAPRSDDSVTKWLLAFIVTAQLVLGWIEQRTIFAIKPQGTWLVCGMHTKSKMQPSSMSCWWQFPPFFFVFPSLRASAILHFPLFLLY